MFRTRTPVVRTPKLRSPVEGSFCNYSHRVCMQNRLEGYDYCLKHILEDKNSLFKQCSFVSTKTGKRCPNAAPKSDRKEGFCQEHLRRSNNLRQKSSQKKRPQETAESLLEELAGYNASLTPGGDTVTLETKKTRGLQDGVANRVLDYASSSDSDAEPPLVDQAWRGDGDSDAESIDSEHEDPLKHAGVYTADEVALIYRDKLIRLQSLYIDQFKRLQHVMREKRRKYLQSYKQERETLGSIKAYKQVPEQRDKYDKLRALKRYHKKYGKESLLLRQSKQRRMAVSEGANYRPPQYNKCVITEEGVKCGMRTLPMSKYCAQHILHDPHQVLFRPCSFGEGRCGRPVANFAEAPRCRLHLQLPPMRSLPPTTSATDVSTAEADVGSVEVMETKDEVVPGSSSEITESAAISSQTGSKMEEIVDVSNDVVDSREGFSEGGTQTTLFLNGKTKDIPKFDKIDEV